MSFFKQYTKLVRQALTKVHKTQFTIPNIESFNRVFVAGNGGSAAIANHLTCDWSKGTDHHKHRPIPVISLSTNVELLTAISNDFGYEKSFVYQLRMHNPTPNDVLILISSSGNSPNIIEAARFAGRAGIRVIGLTGFDGGALKKICKYSIHVASDNYGVVEDCHQIIMHSIAQNIKQQRSNK